MTSSMLIPPGEMIKDELIARGITQKELAKQMGVSYTVFNEILNGKRPVTTEYALLLEAALGTSASIWIGLQADYNMQKAKQDKSFMRNSIDNRLSESIGQTNRVLLHITVDYTPSALARSIKRYLESNPHAKEVLVFKGKKHLSVTQKSLEDNNFFQTFIRRYTK